MNSIRASHFLNWNIRLPLIMLLLCVASACLFAQGSGQQSPGLISIPGPEMVVRAIWTDTPPPSVPPPSRAMRLSPQKRNAATFNVTYTGFTSEAQTAFQYAVNIWAGLLDSPVTINIAAEYKDLGNPNLLGSASSNLLWVDFSGAPASSTWFSDALADRRYCADLYFAAYGVAGTADIKANFNSAFANWYFGTDGVVPGGKWDFVSVVLHEIAHGLGFSGSWVSVSGGQGRWDNASNPGWPAIFTRFVKDGVGNTIISYTSPSAALGNALQGGSSGVFWTGQFGTAGNSGIAPTMYSPNPWETGSSFSHFDQTTYSGELMRPSLPNGTAIHSPGSRTLGVFRDIGWGDELVIEAYNAANPARPEWVKIQNNASTSINLSDYAIGNAARMGSVTTGMYLLPNISLGSGSQLLMRVRSDGVWPSLPNPTYCWECTSGYTNLTKYTLWATGSANLDDTNGAIVLLRTNGGLTDASLTTNDYIIDAVCYGSGPTYVDTNGNGSPDGRDKYIYTDHSCLSNTNGSYKRAAQTEACVPASAYVNNPTAVRLQSFEAEHSFAAGRAKYGWVWFIVPIALVLLGLAFVYRRRMSH